MRLSVARFELFKDWAVLMTENFKYFVWGLKPLCRRCSPSCLISHSDVWVSRFSELWHIEYANTFWEDSSVGNVAEWTSNLFTLNLLCHQRVHNPVMHSISVNSNARLEQHWKIATGKKFFHGKDGLLKKWLKRWGQISARKLWHGTNSVADVTLLTFLFTVAVNDE